MTTRRLAIGTALVLAATAACLGWFARDLWRPRSAGATGPLDGARPSERRASEAALAQAFDGTLHVSLRCDAGLPAPSTIRVSVAGAAGASRFLVTMPDAAGGGSPRVAPEPGEPARLRASVAGASADEVRLDVAGVADGTYSLDALRIDAREPPLRADAVVVAVPEAASATLSLRPPGDDGVVAVRLRGGEIALARARAKVSREGAPDALGIAPLRDPTRGRGEDAGRTLEATFVVPPDVALRVEVVDFEPGAPALGLPSPVTVTVGARKVVFVDLDVPQGALATFRAVDDSGEPIPFGLSVWRPREGGRPLAVPLSVTDDSTSRVKRMRMRPGRYVVQASPLVRYAPAWREVELGDAGLDVVFPAREDGIRARLRITHADGSPAARERVNLNRASDALVGACAHVATTDDDGSVTTPFLPRGTYRVVVWKDRRSALVELDSDEVRAISLPRDDPEAAGSVRGAVADADGAPLAFTMVFLEDGEGRGRVADVDATGRYAFEHVPAGSYRLVLPYDAYARVDHAPASTPVEVVDGAATTRDLRTAR